jgi:hypothetical protein
MACGRSLIRRVTRALLAGGILVMATAATLGQSADSKQGVLSQARQIPTSGQTAPPIQKVSGSNSSTPIEAGQVKRQAPPAKNVPSAETTSWWQRFSRKPRRTAYEFWSQDRINP